MRRSPPVDEKIGAAIRGRVIDAIAFMAGAPDLIYGTGWSEAGSLPK